MLPELCPHEWVSGDNKYITGISYCTLCQLLAPTDKLKEIRKEQERRLAQSHYYVSVAHCIVDADMMAAGRRIFKEREGKTCGNETLRACLKMAATRAIAYCDAKRPTGT